MKDSVLTVSNLFNDFDRYAEYTKQGMIEHSQLSHGKFNGKLIQHIHGLVILSCHRMDQTILQRGVGLKGYTTFLIPGNMNQEFVWRKHLLKGNVIGILKSEMEHSCLTRPNFFGTPVSIQNDYLLEISERLGFPFLVNSLKHKETITIPKESAKNLHQLIISCCANPALSSEALIVEILKVLFYSISLTKSEKFGFREQSRGKVFGRAQEVIESNLQNPLSVLELSLKVGVSERNLRYIFQNQVGISPKKYIRNFKLNLVRKKLKKEKNENIIALARDQGFWHSGQFARDYKMLFGELPSQTKSSRLHMP